jgi:ferredoxin, 2Fe-2S
MAERRFRIRFEGNGGDKTLEIDAEERPSSRTGEPGSLLDMALASGIEIDHACGGVAACATCHVIVSQGLSSCSEPTEPEEDQLDRAPGVTPGSRLACQCVPSGSKDLIVRIPAWNRNLVRESQ